MIQKTIIKKSGTSPSFGETQTQLEGDKEQIKSIINKYHQIFEGIGEIRTIKRNNREIYGQFHMKPDAKSVT